MKDLAARSPLFLALLLLPLAVAGHNIGVGIVALILFAQIYARRASLPWAELKAQFGAPLALSLAFVLLLVVASAVNPANPDRFSESLVFGHAIWALLPPVVFLAQPPLSSAEWRRLTHCLAFVTAVMGLVAIAQSIWGFRLQGTHFVDSTTRARGFYSHPLTFAYVGLVLFPLGAALVARTPRSWATWAQFLGAAAIVYASQSRTVQAVCAIVVGFNVLYFARGRVRLWLFAGAAVAVLIVALTPNPVRQRFAETLAGGHDVRSGYVDDRLAFWDANWEMFKDRPWLGHGDHLDTAYRLPYYERLGLGQFERIYEAHNMYLQLAVNAGVLGLGVFLAWYGWCLRRSVHLGRANFAGKVASQTLVALALAAISQNAFQDSEVRYAMTLLCVALWMADTRVTRPTL